MEEEISPINFLAKTNFRNEEKKFGIKSDDRRRHVYVVGKTGVGKTTLLQNMAIQDIQNGKGLAVVDPHGEFAEDLLNFVPPRRVNDVIYFNPADLDWPIAFNAIEKVAPEARDIVVSGLMGIFKKIWPDVWSARMEYILNNTLWALIEQPNTTLLGINRMLADKEYRDKIIDKLQDPATKSFWVNEFNKYPDRFREEAVAPIQNKVGQFISSPLIRNIIGQTKSAIDMRDVMDSGKILLLNLSKGKIGEEASRLLGALFITKLQLAAMSRVDVPEAQRRDFYLYVDEFQNFATDSFANILSEARKYRLNLILTHQYIKQLIGTDGNAKVKDAVFGNVGTLIAFRVGADDAEFLENEFTPEFTIQDFVNLPFAHVYIKLMIDGTTSRPFSATTLPPLPRPEISCAEKIVRVSRERYGQSRKSVEEKIAKWSGILEKKIKSEVFEKGTGMVKKTEPVFKDRCWRCDREIEINFKPDGQRPVYCKECLKGAQRETARSQQAKTNPGQTRQAFSGKRSFGDKKAEEEIKISEAIGRDKNRQAFQKEKKPEPKIDLAGLRATLDKALSKKKKPDKRSGEQKELPEGEIAKLE